MILGQRFGVGDIEQCRFDAVLLQCFDQRRLVHHVAARDIHQHAIGPHCSELHRTDHMPRLGRRRHGEHDPVEFAQSPAPFAGLQCPIRARTAHRHHLHVERLEPRLDERSDRPHPQQQHAFTRQFALARAVEQPFVPVLRAHHLTIALGMRKHQHDDIFGNGDCVYANAIGDHHAALGEQVERHEIEPGVDRVHPFEPGRGARDLDHRLFLVEVEPADLRLRREFQRLLLAREPQRLDPIGQARFDQRTDHGGQDGFGHRNLPRCLHCRSGVISQTVPCGGWRYRGSPRPLRWHCAARGQAGPA